MNNSETQTVNERSLQTKASFSIRFGSSRGASDKQDSQIHIQDHQSGNRVMLPESSRTDWANWILKQLNLPYGADPYGEKTMLKEVAEASSPEQKLTALYHQDMHVARAPGTRSESLLRGVSNREGDGRQAHTPVSNEASAGGFIHIDESAYGALGPPRDKNELEIETAVVAGRRGVEAAAEALAETDEALLLDAWHAEFSRPGTMTLMRNPSVTKAMTEALEVLIGPDDRQRVTNGLTEEYPWRCVCSLRILAGDGSMWIGTGWLAGPRLVVTAGHNVYMHKQGGWARAIEVIPGRDGTRRPYGSRVATKFHSVAGWTELELTGHDYGAIVLPADSSYGEELGWFGYAYYEDGTLENSVVNLSGYPGDKPSGTQWFHSRRIEQLTPETVVYMIDTASGQSGAPVWWLMEDGERVVVAIHTNGEYTGNSATRITEEVYTNIVAWKGDEV